METRELEQYIRQTLDMGLGSQMQGETSYTNSFDIHCRKDGFEFIPRLPAGYVIGNELYQQIYELANAALYPEYTLLKQNSAYFIPLETNDIHIERALFFPWMIGTSKRLVISDLDEFAMQSNGKLPIMQNLTINVDKITSIAVAGNSGSGKSYMLTYLLTMLKPYSELIIVDPKYDTPSRWGHQNEVPVIHPDQSRSKSDFVSQVNEQLSQCLNVIYDRQNILFSDPGRKFNHIFIAIDEVMSLSEGINKSIKESFFSLISQIALLGRATRVHLLLVSQRFDYKTIPVSVREQLNVLIQLGNISRTTTQFLYADLDPTGIVIPTGQGTGLIQVIDSEHPYQVLPLLCPTYLTKAGIL